MSTAPAQPYSVAPTQRYTLSEHVPGTVRDPADRVVSKTHLDLVLKDLYFRASQTKNE